MSLKQFFCVCVRMHIVYILLGLDVIIFHLKEYSHAKHRRDRHNLIKKKSLPWSAGSSLAKSIMSTQFIYSLTPPRVCRGKIGRTVARMVMCQDRQGNSIFTIVRRKNLRKNNLYQSKMNIKWLIFVVGNKGKTIQEYLSFSFPGSTSLLCLRLLTPNASGRWSGRR